MILQYKKIGRWQDYIYGEKVYIVLPSRSCSPHVISGIVEKPSAAQAPSLLGVIGHYILTPAVFAELSHSRAGRGEIQLTDAIARVQQREKVLAYEFDGRRYDCGSKLGYLEANVELGKRHPEIGAAFRRYLRTVAK